MRSSNIKYSKICSNLLKGMPERTTDVIVRRFGLKGGDIETLEAIGKTYNITRERVRQIEKEGLSKIKPKAKAYGEVFAFFKKVLDNFGGLKKEDVLLSFLGEKKNYNQILFLFNLSDECFKFYEDEQYHCFWASDKKAIELAKKIVDLAINSFEKEKKPLTLEEFSKIDNNKVLEIMGGKTDLNVIESYLEISKRIQKNFDGQWGLREWVEINPRGIKDKAYLVIKKVGKSLHFREVARLIEKSFCSFGRKVNIATVHNELIKDPRFVLVGRGLYALREWGYEPGIVKDIILKVLNEAKQPLSKEDIIKEVLKQRFVKENTVFLNLQDKNLFVKNSDGKYTVREA